MAAKNNIRSIRISDQLLEAVEAQQGRNFTEKFENLIFRCRWELPGVENELKRLDLEIRKKRKELQQYQKTIDRLKQMEWHINQAESYINNVVKAAAEIEKETS